MRMRKIGVDHNSIGGVRRIVAVCGVIGLIIVPVASIINIHSWCRFSAGHRLV